MRRFFAIVLFGIMSAQVSAQNSGNALNFDGVDDFVGLPSNILTSTSFTIETWVKWNGEQSTDIWQRVFDFGVSQSNYMYFTPSNGNTFLPQFGFRTSASVSDVIVSNGTELTKGIWHHIAIVYDDGLGEILMIIDGEQVGSGPVNSTIGTFAPDLNYIGQSQFDADYFNGEIDEFRIWTYAKTIGDIQSEMWDEITGSEGSLDMFANFNEGTAFVNNSGFTTLPDLTGNGNDGILTHFTLDGTTSNWVRSDWASIAAWHPFTDGFVTDNARGTGGDFTGNVFLGTDRFGEGEAIALSGGHVFSDLLMSDNQAFSISVWVNWDGSTGFNNVVSWYDGALSARSMLSINGDNSGEIRFGDSWANTNVFILPNVWTHIVATYDGNSTSRIYINDQFSAENTSIVGGYNFKQSSPSFYIGALNDGGEHFFGTIDDVRIYNSDIESTDPELAGSITMWAYPHSFDEIYLEWDPVDGAVGYRLDQSDDGGSSYFELDGSIGAGQNDYFVGGLNQNTVYYFTLHAVGSDGSEISVERFTSTFSNPKNSAFDFMNFYGDTGSENLRGASSDANGDLFFAGRANGVGLAGISGTTGPGIVIFKTDQDYNISWVSTVGDDYTYAQDVNVSPSGDVYVTGYFNGDLTFAGTTLTSQPSYWNIFLIKYDNDGNEIWARMLNSYDGANAFAYSVNADDDGFVYVAGSSGDYNFAGQDEIAYGPVLLKFDTDGNELWSSYVYADGYGWGLELAFDGNNIYMGGAFGGTGDFGGTSYTADGSYDIFLASYNLVSGAVEWSRHFNGSGSDRLRALVVDDNGDLFIGGYFTGASLNLDAEYFNSEDGFSEIWAAKVDNSGGFYWANTMGTTSTDRIYDGVTDGSNFFVTGFKSELTADFLGITAENGEMLVGAFDTDGNLIYLQIAEGDAQGDALEYVDGSLFVGGNYWYSISHDGSPIYAAFDGTDVFLARISNFTQSSNISVSYTTRPDTYERGTGGTFFEYRVDADNGVSNTVFAFGKISEVTDDFDADQFNAFVPEDRGGGLYRATLSDEDFGDIGIQYFVAVVDNNGNIGGSDPFMEYTYTRYNGSRSVEDVITPVANSSEPAVTDFRMFSLPVTNGTLSGMVTDSDRAAVFHYNNGNTNELGSSQSLTIGNGYWLIYINGAFEGNYNGDVPKVHNGQPFVKTLNAGWNQLGNPYPFDINWGDVVSYNETFGLIQSGGLSSFYTYVNGFSDNGFGTIGQHEGFFVQSNEPYTIHIPLPAVSSIFARKARKGQQPLDAETWKVPIDLENESLRYHVAAVGMHPEAKSEYDRFDLKPLPSPGAQLEMNTISSDGTPISQSLVETAEGHVWEFEALSTTEAQRSHLKWDNSTFGENDLQLILYDIENDRIIDMRAQDSYPFYLDQSNKFKVIFGDAAFVEQHLVAAEVSVGNAFPNPFNDVVSIPVSLPAGTYQIETRIYNQVGRQVYTHVEDQVSQGVHTIQWDGTDQGGQELSEGMYFYTINLDGPEGRTNHKGKMMLRK